MTAFATRKDFDAWARHRLAEMDAGLAAMDTEMSTVREGVLEASRIATDGARAWRDSFAACVAQAEAVEDDASLKTFVPALREAWINFETQMENWAVAAEQKNVAFDARARALLGVWHAAAAGYKAQAVVATDAQRGQLEVAIDRMEREATLYTRKFEDLQDAGKLSWVAMGEALKESRAAFECASAGAEAALSDITTRK
jgi:hypothetical protein